MEPSEQPLPLPLPTKEQCQALSDEQCRKIQDHLDPDGTRVNKDWELPHQPELIRLYMRLLSFTKISEAMASKINACYKTYNNRFKDWSFPADRYEREQLVRELYALVADSDPSWPARANTTPQTRLPVRLIQPQPPPQARVQTQPEPVESQTSFPRPLQRNRQQTNTQDRISISTTNTWGSVYTSFDDDTFSNHRASIATTNSSVSAGSQYVAPTPPASRPLQPPKHDPQAGSWNDLLNVIPCGKDHSELLWHQHFAPCHGCGFSQWHSLMVQARSIEIGEFVTAMNSLRYIVRVDLAGNFPIHYLMSAGVGMEYFTELLQWGDNNSQNSFGQNPLHALNPQDLGEQLISFLEWFKAREQPQGLLFTQRDIRCRTPLHTLLQQPLERHMYERILRIFPHAAHQLLSFDNKGRNTSTIMNKASLKVKENSHSDYAKIQIGIIEVQQFMEKAMRSRRNSNPKHPFHDIARGTRGISYHSFYFQCRFCNSGNTHSNSYLEQMICACSEPRDRNAPDERGMTPAHALVVLSRCNNDPESTPETASQTAEIFKVLLPADDPNLREALHVLDPEGNSLVFNIATRGLDEILGYVLHLEEPSRRSAMVNTCTKTKNGAECSVLAAVLKRFHDTAKEINLERDENVRARLVEKSNRLTMVKHMLMNAGAQLEPDITTRWRISFA